jgi:hypothetical protein
MFFLLRVGFWLSVVVLLLPTGKPQQNEATPSVTAVDAFSAAAAAVGDMRQFCTRQPDACTVGSHAAQAFGQKAQASAKMVYEFISETAAAGQTASAPSTTAPAASGAEPPAQNTLLPADRSPAWRGPAPAAVEFAKGPG